MNIWRTILKNIRKIEWYRFPERSIAIAFNRMTNGNIYIIDEVAEELELEEYEREFKHIKELSLLLEEEINYIREEYVH